MSSTRRIIVGLAGPDLLDAEKQFLKAVQPAGIILFRRNCDTPEQVRRLTATAQDCIGHDSLVLIDEEGGRVQRLRPPVGRNLPSAGAYLAHHDGDLQAACRAARIIARLTADDLTALGINTNCAPVADLRIPAAHEIVGDRAYGPDPSTVSALARAVAEGFLAGGVVPVLKHIPGHGRAQCDSHHQLPVVNSDRETLRITDFSPFKTLNDLPAAMTAHVVYTDIDPHAPATVSPAVVQNIMRDAIGFEGLIMTDDLSMKALSGTIAERAEAAIKAGCDIALHCNGNLPEMEAAAAVCPDMDGVAMQHFERAIALTRNVTPFDRPAAERALDNMLQDQSGPSQDPDPTA